MGAMAAISPPPAHRRRPLGIVSGVIAVRRGAIRSSPALLAPRPPCSSTCRGLRPRDFGQRLRFGVPATVLREVVTPIWPPSLCAPFIKPSETTVTTTIIMIVIVPSRRLVPGSTPAVAETAATTLSPRWFVAFPLVGTKVGLLLSLLCLRPVLARAVKLLCVCAHVPSRVNSRCHPHTPSAAPAPDANANATAGCANKSTTYKACPGVGHPTEETGKDVLCHAKSEGRVPKQAAATDALGVVVRLVVPTAASRAPSMPPALGPLPLRRAWALVSSRVEIWRVTSGKWVALFLLIWVALLLGRLWRRRWVIQLELVVLALLRI